MNDIEERPLAESFLEEAKKEGRGKLKIFLGAAPGVGKTFAMLQAAHERKNEGVDVVAAVVETHGRAETEKLVVGLEILPKTKINYRGRDMEEMDLEGILARKPQLILVDELAHTNVPGSIHEKRYQDVEILLQNKIDVYSTLNIQHLESLNDIIYQIAKIKVRETLPDHILKEADEVELVDLPPKELIRRLSEGKVYVKDQARRAIKNFFSPSNLTALRELALRHTAEQVDDQMLTLMQQQAIKGPWPTRDRVMVCVDHDVMSEDLVRTASRISARRRAPLLAVYVETPTHYLLPEKKKEQIHKTLQLAENLGAETSVVHARTVVSGIIEFASQKNVTMVVIGQKPKNFIMKFFIKSTTYDVIGKSGDIDVLVINKPQSEEQVEKTKSDIKIDINLMNFLKCNVALFISFLCSYILNRHLGVQSDSLEVVFLPPVLYSALLGGIFYGAYSSLISVLTYDLLFSEPLLTFTLPLETHLLIFGTFFFTSVVAASIANRAKHQAVSSLKREKRTSALYELSKEMTSALHLDDVLAAIVVKMDSILNAETLILMPEDKNKGLRVACPPEFEFDEKEYAAALWSYEHEEVAGKGTETLTTAERVYLPLKTQRGSVGIIGIKPKGEFYLKDIEFAKFLEALAAQGALSIERAGLAEEIEDAIVTRERESLRSILLSSISYDLKTPITSIIGSSSSLSLFDRKLSKEDKGELINIINEESEKLNRFITNLIEITKLESGSAIPKMELVNINEVITHSLYKLRNLLAEFEILPTLDLNLPLIRGDFLMLEQVVSNLLDNAAKFSKPNDQITVKSYMEDDSIVIEIRDKGHGIPAEEMEKIFDKFYRIKMSDSRVSGTGLGLSLCKSILTSHGAEIKATAPNDSDGGTVLKVIFPPNLLMKLR